MQNAVWNKINTAYKHKSKQYLPHNEESAGIGKLVRVDGKMDDAENRANLQKSQQKKRVKDRSFKGIDIQVLLESYRKSYKRIA